MDLTVKSNELSIFVENFKSGNVCRVEKQLDNGNLAIMQIANPDQVPKLTKKLRLMRERNLFWRFLCSLESSIRVFGIVFCNSWKKDRITTRRKKKAKKNKRAYNYKKHVRS